MADFFHMNIEEADIAAAIRAAGPRIVYVHVADSNCSAARPRPPRLPSRFRRLKAVGYDGFLGVECPRRLRPSTHCPRAPRCCGLWGRIGDRSQPAASAGHVLPAGVHQRRDGRRRRPGRDLLRAADLDDPPGLEHDQAVAEGEGLARVVGDDQRRRPRLAQPRGELGHQRRPRRGVERGEGLVEEEQIRLDREGARQADPLRLPAGKGASIAAREVADAEPLQPTGGRRSASRRPTPRKRSPLAAFWSTPTSKRSGSWKTVAVRRRSAARVRRMTRSPPIRTSPASGVRSSAATWRSVLLPAPFGPITATTSPRSTRSSGTLRTGRSPYRTSTPRRVKTGRSASADASACIVPRPPIPTPAPRTRRDRRSEWIRAIKPKPRHAQRPTCQARRISRHSERTRNLSFGGRGRRDSPRPLGMTGRTLLAVIRAKTGG